MCSSVRSATHGTDRLVCISCNRVLLLSIPAAPATSLVPLPRSIPPPDPLPFLLRSHKWKSQRTGSQPAAVLCRQQRRICEGAPRSLRAVACVSKIRGDPGTEDHGVVPWLPGKCDFPCGGLRCHYTAICQNSTNHFEKLQVWLCVILWIIFVICVRHNIDARIQSGLTSLLFSTNLRGSASEVSAHHPELR